MSAPRGDAVSIRPVSPGVVLSQYHDAEAVCRGNTREIRVVGRAAAAELRAPTLARAAENAPMVATAFDRAAGPCHAGGAEQLTRGGRRLQSDRFDENYVVLERSTG